MIVRSILIHTLISSMASDPYIGNLSLRNLKGIENTRYLQIFKALANLSMNDFIDEQGKGDGFSHDVFVTEVVHETRKKMEMFFPGIHEDQLQIMVTPLIGHLRDGRAVIKYSMNATKNTMNDRSVSIIPASEKAIKVYVREVEGPIRRVLLCLETNSKDEKIMNVLCDIRDPNCKIHTTQTLRPLVLPNRTRIKLAGKETAEHIDQRLKRQPDKSGQEISEQFIQQQWRHFRKTFTAERKGKRPTVPELNDFMAQLQKVDCDVETKKNLMECGELFCNKKKASLVICAIDNSGGAAISGGSDNDSGRPGHSDDELGGADFSDHCDDGVEQISAAFENITVDPLTNCAQDEPLPPRPLKIPEMFGEWVGRYHSRR